MKTMIALLAAAALAPAQAITGGQSTQNFKAVGIGVQVSPDWVVTARHAAIGAGGTYENGYGMRTVAEVFVPDTGDFPGNDIALLRLVPQTGLPSVIYPRLASVPFLPGSFRPQPVTITSSQNGSPRGLAITAVTEAIMRWDDDGPDGPLPEVDVNWLVSWDPLVHLENGDSGGGLFLDPVRDSSGIILLGLNSALLPMDDGRLGSAFVQTGAYRSWIDGVMSADLRDDQLLSWIDITEPITGAVPEPASWALLLAGGAWLAARRRRA